MNESKQSLTLPDQKAINNILMIRYSKKPNKFAKILNLMKLINYSCPLPKELKQKFKKDIPSLILMNYFVNPSFHYHTNNNDINMIANFLDSLIDKIKTVYQKFPSELQFNNFITNIINYFREPNQYQNLHDYLASISDSPQDLKLLLSFSNDKILYVPMEYPLNESISPIEYQNDYMTFLALIGCGLTHPRSSSTSVNKFSKSSPRFYDNLDDYSAMPKVSYSYRDPIYFQPPPIISNSTPLLDLVVNHRFISVSSSPAASTASNGNKAEVSKRHYNDDQPFNEVNDLSLPNAMEGSESLHNQEYKMKLVEEAFLDLKHYYNVPDSTIQTIQSKIAVIDDSDDYYTPIYKPQVKNKTRSKTRKYENLSDEAGNKISQVISMLDQIISSVVATEIKKHSDNRKNTIEKSFVEFDPNLRLSNVKGPFVLKDHWRVERVLSMLYEKSTLSMVLKMFQQTSNHEIDKNLSDNILYIMRHMFSTYVKMKVNWYKSQAVSFLSYSRSMLRIFPSPDYCNLALAHLRHSQIKDSVSKFEILEQFCEIIRNASSDIDTATSYILDEPSINLLTVFCQYYKWFLFHHFYDNYMKSANSFFDSSIKWKKLLAAEMKIFMNNYGIDETENQTKVFIKDKEKRCLSEQVTFLIKGKYLENTASYPLVRATFLKSFQLNGFIQEHVTVQIEPINQNQITENDVPILFNKKT